MRGVISIILVLLSIIMAVTGIMEMLPGQANSVVLDNVHAVISFMFMSAVCLHGWLNRKAIVKYLRHLHWKWSLVVVLTIIVLTVPFFID
jgi:hypothetical protein